MTTMTPATTVAERDARIPAAIRLLETAPESPFTRTTTTEGWDRP